MEYSVGCGTKLTEAGVEVPLPRGSEKVPERQPGDANFRWRGPLGGSESSEKYLVLLAAGQSMSTCT